MSEVDLDAWRAWQEAPWGRIRYALVADVLDDLTPRAGTGPVTVLDVGGGDGRDSVRLAGQGHQVTVLDADPDLLELADRRIEAERAGNRATTLQASLDDLPGAAGDRFDLVLCHFVLGYRDDLAADLVRLAGCARPGGYVSLVGPNPDGAVLRSLVVGGPSVAAERLLETSRRAEMFGADVLLRRHEEVERTAADAGLRVVSRSGGRVANDLLVDDERKQHPAAFEELLRLERALAAREPFWRLGHYWHLVLQRVR